MTAEHAWVVTVGDELLRGEIVDSNKSFMSERLLQLDIETTRHVTVADDADEIEEILCEAAARARVVLVSGGLGPTRDDITTAVAARTFGREIVRDAQALEDIRTFFEQFGREMAPNNAKQADFPEGADILRNPIGTAPGFMLEVERTLLFFMPGVPRELYRMMDEQVLPRVRSRLGRSGVVRAALLRTFGMGESNLDVLLDDLVRDDPDAQLGFRTQFPDNLLRVVVRAWDDDEAEAKLRALVGQLSERLGDLIIGEGETPLEHVIAKMLVEQGKTIALAESCSGGLVAHRLTDVPGSARYLLAAQLDPSAAATLPTARAMAEGVRQRAGADIGLATAGRAEPHQEEGPVGTVYIALADSEGTIAYRYQLMSERARNKQMSAHLALDWVRRRLLGLKITSETFPRLRGEDDT